MKQIVKQHSIVSVPGIALAMLVLGCNNPSSTAGDVSGNIDTLQYTVEEAPEWTALFQRNHGWIGGDGIFTIPVNGVDTYTAGDTTETLIQFGDTMIGDIENDSLQPGLKVIRNSYLVLKGNEPDSAKLSFHWDTDSAGNPATVFIPDVPFTKKGDIAWLGDGFVNQELDSSYFAFCYVIRMTGPTDWDFADVGNVLFEMPKGSRPPFKNHTQTVTPLYINASSDSARDNGAYGACIFANTAGAGAPDPDGYVYVYGIHGSKKNVVVARVKPADFRKFDQWRFYDGKTWSSDMNKAATIADSASNEMSVSPMPDGRYAMVFQVNGMSPYVGLRIGKTPYGPFGKVINIWRCKEVDIVPGKTYTYNAKAHPHWSKPGELLISYNVNSFDFYNVIKTNPDLYRPRFIKLKFR